MDFHFPVNSSPAASPGTGTGQSAIAIAFPGAPQQSQHTQSAPPSHCRHCPVTGQSGDYASVAWDSVQVPPANSASNDQPDENWRDMLPPVENTAAQGQPQDLRFGGRDHYDMANNQPQLQEHHDRDRAIDNYAGLDLDVPAQAQAAPLAPHIDGFDDPAQGRAAGAVPSGPATEALRQLAILYLREPNSQVALIRMEPGHTHGVRVVVTVELAGF